MHGLIDTRTLEVGTRIRISCGYIYIYIYIHTHTYTHLSEGLSVSLSVSLSVYLSRDLSIPRHSTGYTPVDPPRRSAPKKIIANCWEESTQPAMVQNNQTQSVKGFHTRIVIMALFKYLLFGYLDPYKVFTMAKGSGLGDFSSPVGGVWKLSTLVYPIQYSI